MVAALPAHSLPKGLIRGYRADIDGLRAVAVLAVIVYHAQLSFGGMTLLPGGFLGVDIFFVISGFLITSLIRQDVEAGEFRLSIFFERRARRLFPALFTVLMASTVTALLVLDRTALEAFGQEMLAALLFVSNILFAFEDPYFAAEANLRPLLHSWSLGVEEQFYLLWPLILLVILKWRRPGLAICVLLLMSLFAAQWMSGRNSAATFYLLPFRMWELLAGALLAFLPNMPADRVSTLSGFGLRILAMIGIAAPMIMPDLFFGDALRHPSLGTLAPVTATAILIHVGRAERSWLALPWLAWIGRLSYSLYLWHFVILVFVRRLAGGSLSLMETLLCVLAALVLSALSLRWIETPFRKPEQVNRKAFWSIAGTGFIVLLSLAGMLALRGGLTQQTASVADLLNRSERSFFKPDGRFCGNRTFEDACRFSDGTGRPIYLVGDSHGETLLPALVAWGERTDRPVTALIETGCPVLFGYAERPGYPATRRDDCPRQSQEFRNALIGAEPGDVIYFTFLSAYFGQEAAPGSLARPALIRDVDPARTDLSRPLQTGMDAFRELKAAGHRIILVDTYPQLSAPPKDALNGVTGTLDDIRAALPNFSRNAYQAQRANIAEIYAQIIIESDAYHVDPADWLCVGESCDFLLDGDLTHSDSDHPSPIGATYIVDAIEERLGNTR